MNTVIWVKLEVEVELREMLRGVGLVGELDLSPSGRAFMLARGNMERLLRSGLSSEEVAQRYPATTVVYLVAQGVYRYDHGGFWTELDLGGIDPLEMGRGFSHALRQLGLETFESVKPEGAYRWITPILLHGGIPRFCARDVLKLLVDEMRDGSGDATEMVAHWVQSPARMFVLDRPVQRFLTYGGEQAIDLVERLIAMVVAAADGESLDPMELGVPAYLVEEFLALPTEARRVRSQVTASPIPSVTFDYTCGLGPELNLPPVPAAIGASAWVVIGDRHQRLPVSQHSERVLPLSVGSSWEVALTGADGLFRSTNFRGASGTPVLFFDPATMMLLRSQERLAVDDVVALAPHGFRFRVGGRDGEAIRLLDAELPPLEGPWRWYEAHHLDLRGVTSMWIGDPAPTLGLQSAAATIQIAGPSQRPHLVADACLGVTSADGRIAYAAPPVLVVPGGVAAWDRWQLRLRVNGEQVSRALSEHEVVGGRFDLAQVLPADTVAIVDLDVVGPLGRDLRHVRFALVPGLSVQRLSRVLGPDEPARVAVSVAPTIELGGTHRPTSDVVFERGEDTAVLVASDAVTEISLLLTIPRLMWALRRGREDLVPLAATRVLLGIDEVGRDDVLIVRTRERVKLSLELAAGTTILQELPWVETVGSDGRWAFSLMPFLDTIRTADRARVCLQIRLGGHAVPVADIVTEYIVAGLLVESQVFEADGSVELVVEFEENRCFPDRELRVWSSDRPWEPARILPIRDGLRGRDAISLHADLSPGRYLIEVALGDGWGIPVRPAPTSSSAFDITIGDSGDRRRYLQRLDPSDPCARYELALASPLAPLVFEAEAQAAMAPYAVQTIMQLVDEQGALATNDARYCVAAKVLSTAASLTAGLGLMTEAGQLHRDDVLRMMILILPDFWALRGDGDESERRRLHRLHPIVGALLDPASVDDLAAGARWAEHLGWDPNDADPGRAYPAKGGEVGAQWLQLSPDRLREISFSLDLSDQQPLAAGGFIKAMFDWLGALHDETNAATTIWIERHRSLNDRRVTRLSEMHEAFLAAVKPKGLGCPTVARFPWDLLAAAIQLVSIPSSRRAATKALLDAVAIAPGLTVRSLLVAIVLERG